MIFFLLKLHFGLRKYQLFPYIKVVVYSLGIQQSHIDDFTICISTYKSKHDFETSAFFLSTTFPNQISLTLPPTIAAPAIVMLGDFDRGNYIEAWDLVKNVPDFFAHFRLLELRYNI